jgi:hypothetical protein
LHRDRCDRRLRDAQYSGAWLPRPVADPIGYGFFQCRISVGTCREIQIGYHSALAVRLTYVGELGWKLYLPTAFALAVYDALVTAGSAHGLRHCGYHTLGAAVAMG